MAEEIMKEKVGVKAKLDDPTTPEHVRKILKMVLDGSVATDPTVKVSPDVCAKAMDYVAP